MFTTSGTVTDILEYGFKLDSGTIVSTQTPGSRPGLRRGDDVQVTGGPGGNGVFLSSSAWKKVLFGRVTIRVPVNSHEKRSLLWWL
jgi:hypothetical protein